MNGKCSSSPTCPANAELSCFRLSSGTDVVGTRNEGLNRWISERSSKQPSSAKSGLIKKGPWLLFFLITGASIQSCFDVVSFSHPHWGHWELSWAFFSLLLIALDPSLCLLFPNRILCLVHHCLSYLVNVLSILLSSLCWSNPICEKPPKVDFFLNTVNQYH